MELPPLSAIDNVLSVSYGDFVEENSLFTLEITELPYPSMAQNIVAASLLLVAVLLSLAVVFHWLSYGRHPLMGLVVLTVYTIGFVFFVGLIIASGVFII